MFSIEELKNENYLEIIIRNNSTGEFITVLPESGGRIKEAWLNNGSRNVSILRKINDVNSDNRDDIFTNAKLSPFAGRISGGKYEYNNQKYELALNYPEENNACHGFVYDKKFTVEEKGTSEDNGYCALSYKYEGSEKGFPFKYDLKIKYSLSSQNGITCSTKIINNNTSLLLSDGWHHYFDLNTTVNDLLLKLNVQKRMDLDARNIPNGKEEIYNEFKDISPLNDIALDDCFLVNNHSDKIVTELISEKENIHLNIWQETGENKYNYLVIYTPPNRKTIAIEPITSNINSFNNGKGLIQLAPNAVYESSFGMYLSRS